MLRLVTPLLLGLVMTLALPASSALAQGACCQFIDVGIGTVKLPADCQPNGYEGSMVIDDGLVGATIEIMANLKDFNLVVEIPGGSLGGTTSSFAAVMVCSMSGTGTLAGFNRLIAINVQGNIDWAPRVSGDAVQSLAAELISLEGQLFGDPDFDSLMLRAGSDFGLASPGSATLTRVGPPGSDFAVESFFDIHYEIEYSGAPGSVLEQNFGTSSDQRRFEICPSAVPVVSSTWGLLKVLYR